MSKCSGGGSSSGGSSKSSGSLAAANYTVQGSGQAGRVSQAVSTEDWLMLKRAMDQTVTTMVTGEDGVERERKTEVSRDYTSELMPAMCTFAKGGLDLTISVSFGEKLETKARSQMVKMFQDNSKELFEEAGFAVFDEDKEEELFEAAARFLLATNAEGEVVAFADFRFTIQGDVCESLKGLPCLLVHDLQVHIRIPAAVLFP